MPTEKNIRIGYRNNEHEELFALEFMEWIGEIVDTKGIHLAVDGKALRAGMEKVKDFRVPMILNAVDVVTGLVVAQMPIKNKECEIKAIPELLKLLDIQGSIVTTDAVGTQTEITDTGRKGRAGKRYDTGYKNISGKGLKAETKTNPGGRNRKRYPGNRDDLGHGTVGGRNGADKKGTLGN